MQLFVKFIPLKPGTAEATADGEVVRCPADVAPDTILSFLTQEYGEIVETAWTSTARHDRVACGWILAGTSARGGGPELLCVPMIETSDGSLHSLFEALADQRVEFDERARSGELGSYTAINLHHRPYGPSPGDADVIDDGSPPSASADAGETPSDRGGPDTNSAANVVSKGGGHRHGAGRAGTTEFPATWTDDQVLRNVLSVARQPDRAVWQENKRWRLRGRIDGVEIIAIVRSDGEIVTAWPLPGGRGVQQNPAWSMNANESQIAARMKRLPGRFSDRLPADDTDGLHAMASAGEWEEEIDLLIASLVSQEQPVSSQERNDLRNLLTQLGMPLDQLEKVPLTDP